MNVAGRCPSHSSEAPFFPGSPPKGDTQVRGTSLTLPPPPPQGPPHVTEVYSKFYLIQSWVLQAGRMNGEKGAPHSYCWGRRSPCYLCISWYQLLTSSRVGWWGVSTQKKAQRQPLGWLCKQVPREMAVRRNGRQTQQDGPGLQELPGSSIPRNIRAGRTTHMDSRT